MGLTIKIKTECAYQNKAIPVFLGSTAALCVLSLLYLDVDWIKLAGRVPDMGSIFYRLAQFDFKYMDLIAAAMWENAFHYGAFPHCTVFILGLFFACLRQKIFFRMRWLSVLVQSWFTFLRAVPTPGMGAFNDGVPWYGACRRYCRFVRAYNGVFYPCFRAEL